MPLDKAKMREYQRRRRAPASTPGERADGHRQAPAAATGATAPKAATRPGGNPEPSRPAPRKMYAFDWRETIQNMDPHVINKLLDGVVTKRKE